MWVSVSGEVFLGVSVLWGASGQPRGVGKLVASLRHEVSSQESIREEAGLLLFPYILGALLPAPETSVSDSFPFSLH